jgi:hypothetical protein
MRNHDDSRSSLQTKGNPMQRGAVARERSSITGAAIKMFESVQYARSRCVLRRSRSLEEAPRLTVVRISQRFPMN